MKIGPKNRVNQLRTDLDKPVDQRETKRKKTGIFGRFVKGLSRLKGFISGREKNDGLPQVDLSSRNASPQKMTMNLVSDESSESSLSTESILLGEESASSYDRQESTDSAINVSSFPNFKRKAKSPVGYSDQPSKGLLNNQVSDDPGFYDEDLPPPPIPDEDLPPPPIPDGDFPPPPTSEELDESFELDLKPSRTPDEAWQEARKPGGFSSFLPKRKARTQENNDLPPVPEKPDVDKQGGKASKLNARNNQNLRLKIPEQKGNTAAQAGDNRKERPTSQVKAPPAPPPPPVATLSAEEKKQLDKLKKQHQEQVQKLQGLQRECQNRYKQFINLRSKFEIGGQMAMTLVGPRAVENKWMDEGAELFGEAFKCHSSWFSCHAELTNNLEAITGQNAEKGEDALLLMNKLKASIDDEFYDQPYSDINPYVAKFRRLKLALLGSIGVNDPDELSKSMSRAEFKHLQEVFEDKILGTGINKIPLKILVDHFVEQALKDLPPPPAEPIQPACNWLTEDEIKLLETLGGPSYFDAQKSNSRRTPQSIFGENGATMDSYQALYDRVANFDKGGKSVSGSHEKDRKMLERVEKLKGKLETQPEAVKESFRKDFTDFLDNKRKFTSYKEGMETVQRTLGDYAQKLLRRSMVSLSNKPPIGDDVLPTKAQSYELKKGDNPDSWFLVTGSNDNEKCVKWCEKTLTFVEGCSQQEAESSYANNKPLLCVYDEPIFAREEVYKRAFEARKARRKQEAEYKEVSPPPEADSSDPSLLSADTLPVGFSENQKALEKKMAAINQQCKDLEDYQEKVRLARFKISSLNAPDDGPNTSDPNDPDQPIKLVEQFMSFDDHEGLDCLEALDGIPSLKQHSKRIYPQLLKICHDVVTEEVEKNNGDLSNLLKDLANTSQADWGMRVLKKNIKEARFKQFDLKWKSIGDTFVEKVFNRIGEGGIGGTENNNPEYMQEKLRQISEVKACVNRACCIFYKMKCQNPPMVFEWSPSEADLNNPTALKKMWNAHGKPWPADANRLEVDYVALPLIYRCAESERYHCAHKGEFVALRQ